MVRHEGHVVSEATVLRLLRDEGLILSAQYQRERRKLAERRKAAFAKDPTGPNQVWQLDFSEFETTTGGTWRLAGCRDYWSKYEHPFHVSPTANQHDAIDAIELALADFENLFDHPMVDDCPVEVQTGELLPVVTIVTDNGGPFRSFRFEAFIALHPELHHVRTRVRTPGQNGSRERGFGTLKYERLFIDEIDDAVMLAKHAEEYRLEYNQIRPHEAIAWNFPLTNVRMFREPIAMLVPGREHRIFFDSNIDRSTRPDLPNSYQVTVSYRTAPGVGGEMHKEVFPLDLKAREGARYIIRYGISDVAEHLKEIRHDLHASGLVQGPLDVRTETWEKSNGRFLARSNWLRRANGQPPLPRSRPKQSRQRAF